MSTDLEFLTLWMQFLFLHAAGPDSITAYALQDNELWKRHLFGLVSLTFASVYIFLLAYSGENLGLSFLSICMFVIAFIKNAERVWTLP